MCVWGFCTMCQDQIFVYIVLSLGRLRDSVYTGIDMNSFGWNGTYGIQHNLYVLVGVCVATMLHNESSFG